MHRLLVAAWAASGLWLLALAPNAASAQAWNDARSRALVERATALRAQQLADTGLKDYKAVAHGYVTFLVQLGDALTEPPRIVKADELMNEVYWLAPNLSKQRILGRRDTLLLPTDINYHRDHLGIVQNNFPAIIRLGDGDEVVDVPHPLSADGLATYDFAITDSLTLRPPGRTIQVFEVKVRPKDDAQARIIGALYIDRDDAQVVRMAFNFTRSAFRDNALEDLFVVIENSLVGGRFWLPRRQEIEIRRGGTWLDTPLRGIIRGRWEIGEYAVNTGLSPAFFNGQEIVLAPKSVSDTFHFGSVKILDSLPTDVRAVTDADIQRVREEARTLVRAQALQRSQRLSLTALGASDFVRFDRVEGFALGTGIASRFGGGFGAQARARYGVDDRDVKGNIGLDWQSPFLRVRGYGTRDFRDVGDIQERSRLINSLAAQEFGADASAPYLVTAAGLGLDIRDVAGFGVRLDVSLERQESLSVRAIPASGIFEPAPTIIPVRAERVVLAIDHPLSLFLLGTEVRYNAEARVVRYRATLDGLGATAPAGSYARLFGTLTVERPFDSGRLAIWAAGGEVQDNALRQDKLYFGGPVSAPGYGYHDLRALGGGTARLEWRQQVPAPSISLGRFGRIAGTATLAPFLQSAYGRPSPSRANPAPLAGLYSSAGVAVQPFFDLLRFQVARGLRDGHWAFNLDVTRDFWSVL